MKKLRVLVVEDDSAIRRALVDALQFGGFETLEAAEGHKGLEMAARREFDIMLLDLVLPGADGLDILRAVRRSRPTLPVIILTARGEEDDRVEGLRLGADDYVVKPFSVKELMARIEAVLRRTPGRPSDIAEIPIGRGVCDLARCEVRLDDGGRRELTELEVALLRYLAGNRGRTVSRDEILSNVWRIDPRGVDTRTIDMHVARLREKLGDDPARPRIIRTVRGRGYSFEAGEASS